MSPRQVVLLSPQPGGPWPRPWRSRLLLDVWRQLTPNTDLAITSTRPYHCWAKSNICFFLEFCSGRASKRADKKCTVLLYRFKSYITCTNRKTQFGFIILKSIINLVLLFTSQSWICLIRFQIELNWITQPFIDN